MAQILLVLHLLIAIGLIGIVMLQRSEGGGLGMGGGNAFLSVRGTANILTRMTAILAGVFMLTSLALAIVATRSAQQDQQLIPEAPLAAPVAPVAPAPPAN